MTGWVILLCALALLWLVGRLRVGVLVGYREGVLTVRAKAGPLWVDILPQKEKTGQKKKGKPPKEKKKKPKPEKPRAKRSLEETLSLILELLSAAGEAAGKLSRKLRIDRLLLHILWGAANPASAALGFGEVNMALGMAWPVLVNHFTVKEHDIEVEPDFERPSPEITAEVQVTGRVGQLSVFGLSFAVKVLKIWSRGRSRRSGLTSGSQKNKGGNKP